jgi:hypothetical protein
MGLTALMYASAEASTMFIEASRPRKVWSSLLTPSSSETSPCASLPAATPADGELA